MRTFTDDTHAEPRIKLSNGLSAEPNRDVDAEQVRSYHGADAKLSADRLTAFRKKACASTINKLEPISGGVRT